MLSLPFRVTTSRRSMSCVDFEAADIVKITSTGTDTFDPSTHDNVAIDTTGVGNMVGKRLMVHR